MKEETEDKKPVQKEFRVGHPSWDVQGGSQVTCKGLKYAASDYEVGWHKGPNGDWFGSKQQKAAR